MKPTEEQKKKFRAKHHKVLEVLGDQIRADQLDKAAQAQEDHDSMIEFHTDREIFAEIKK